MLVASVPWFHSCVLQIILLVTEALSIIRMWKGSADQQFPHWSTAHCLRNTAFFGQKWSVATIRHGVLPCLVFFGSIARGSLSDSSVWHCAFVPWGDRGIYSTMCFFGTVIIKILLRPLPFWCLEKNVFLLDYFENPIFFSMYSTQIKPSMLLNVHSLGKLSVSFQKA